MIVRKYVFAYSYFFINRQSGLPAFISESTKRNLEYYFLKGDEFCRQTNDLQDALIPFYFYDFPLLNYPSCWKRAEGLGVGSLLSVLFILLFYFSPLSFRIFSSRPKRLSTMKKCMCAIYSETSRDIVPCHKRSQEKGTKPYHGHADGAFRSNFVRNSEKKFIPMPELV